jgi:nicotinate-nucleotide adenylyltransferase
MASLAERLAAAGALADHPRILVSALEAVLGTRYTADSIGALQAHFPRVRFVWLMGADNLIELEFWQNWPQIFHRVPVAVFDRPSYACRALAATAAQRFARHRVRESAARGLATRRPPAWVFLHGHLNPQSATGIRARRKSAQE